MYVSTVMTTAVVLPELHIINRKCTPVSDYVSYILYYVLIL